MKKMNYRIAVPVLLLLVIWDLSRITVAEAQPVLELTVAERDWLANNPDRLTLLFNTEFPPIEFISPSGEFVGMGSDIVTMVEKRLGITFLKHPSNDWNAHLAALESGDCAVAPTIVRTAERETYAFFTTPYATVPVVIITNRSVSGNLELDDLKGQHVGVVSGYATEPYLRDRSLDRFEIVPVENVAEGLRRVAFGQLDAFVENLAVAAHHITREGIPNLRVAGKTDYAFAWSIGVSRKYPLLFSSVQKALNGIPETEIGAVRNRWIALEGHIGMKPETLRMLQLSGLFVAALLFSLSAITFFLKRRLKEKIAGLCESERNYRELVQNANSIILRMDAACRVTFMNEFAQRFFGFREDEILGQPVVGTIVPHNDSSGQDMVAIMNAIAEDPDAYASHENENMRRNGERVWIAWTNNPVFDERGNLLEILCVGNDITALKQARDANTALLRFQNEMLDTAAVWIDTVDTDGNVTFWNRAAERISGYGRNDVLGHNRIWEWLYPDATYRTEIYLKVIDIIRKNERVEHFEAVICRRNGEHRTISWHSNNLVDKAGNVVGRIALGVDTTDQKRVDTALKESEEKFRLIFEYAPLGILHFDKTGRITACNDHFVRIIGSSSDALIGLDMLKLPDERIIKTLQEALQGRMASFEGDYSSVTAKKTTPVRILFGAALSPNGTVDGGIGIIEDISERRQAEKEREKLQTQLQQAQKMESVGRLAGGVAHDFNNMLQSIIGHAEMGLQEIDPCHPLFADLSEILKAAHRSADLTGQLLAFARKQAIRPRVLNLNDTVAGMQKMLHRLIGENIVISWKKATTLWSIKIDPSQVDQILANLCVNARDAISGVGTVTIKTDNVTVDATGCKGVIPGEYVMLEVSDTGMGMDTDTLDQVFEPFFTTKELGKGTGLGLATVYGIVRQNNGFIDVDSEPGKGTTFRIHLPRCLEAADPADTTSNGKSLHGSETILLVEDDDTILDIGKMILERFGYTVLATNNPNEALRLAKNHSGPIHLLITDVIMPEMNGQQLVDCLISIKADIHTLFISGYTADIIARHGVLDEGINFLQKPFSVQTLVEKVREVMDG
ncbi:MAG: PAS domain S-box protein [Desulfatirhabdiaceae bacterium]